MPPYVVPSWTPSSATQGAKLQVGGVPLYVRGDDNRARQFRSLHAVQRHMVDTCQCKLIYDDNEEEFEEFYDYDLGEVRMCCRSSVLAFRC